MNGPVLSQTVLSESGKVKPYRPNDFQKVLHMVPENVSLFLGGTRGGGKSDGLAQLTAYHCEKYGERASVLFIRKGPLKSLRSVTAALRNQFNLLWGAGTHRLNHSTNIWTLPTGSHLELGILPAGAVGTQYYEDAYQGNNYTLILGDEAQAHATPEVLDLLLSNLRSADVPTRFVLSANPGGMGHQWLCQRFIHGPEPWKVFSLRSEVLRDTDIVQGSLPWMSCPSDWRDNIENLGADYPEKLASSTRDAELLSSWLGGNWDIARGSFFATVLMNPHIKINFPARDKWRFWDHRDWVFWLALDHGTAAPMVCFVMARSPGGEGPDGHYYPAESILAVDEYACHQPGDFSKAFGWTVPQLAEPIRALAARWKIPASGVADSQCFGLMGHEKGTIADEYRRCGVDLRPAPKGRREPRFQRMKTMFSDAGKREKAGLYVDGRCNYWWNTGPFLVHDPRDREVYLKCDTDHAGDTLSYGLEAGRIGVAVLRHA